MPPLISPNHARSGPGHSLAPHVAAYQKLLYGKAKAVSQTFSDSGRLRLFKGDDVAGGVANVLMLTGRKHGGASTAVKIPDTPQNGKVFDEFLSLMKQKKMGADSYKVVTLFEKAGHIMRASRYNTLMEMALAGGHWRQGLSLYSHMVQFRVFPVPRTWNYVMDSCRQGGLWGEAVGVFARLVRDRMPLDGYGFTAAISAARLAPRWSVALKVYALGTQVETVTLPSGITVTSAPLCKIDAGVVQTAMRAMEDAQKGNASGVWESALSIISSTCLPAAGATTSSPTASLGAINAALRILNLASRPEKVIQLCSQLEGRLHLSPNPQTLSHLHDAYLALENSQIEADGSIEDGDDRWQQSGLFTVYNWSRSLSLPVPDLVLKSILIQLFSLGKNKSADDFIRMNVELACQNPGDPNLKLQPLYEAIARALLQHPDPFTAGRFLGKHEHRVEAVIGGMTSNLGAIGVESSRMLLEGTSVLVVDGKAAQISVVEQHMPDYSHTLIPFGELVSVIDAGVFDTEDKAKVAHQIGKDRAAFRVGLRFGGIKSGGQFCPFIAPVTYWEQMYANRFLVNLSEALKRNSSALIAGGGGGGSSTVETSVALRSTAAAIHRPHHQSNTSGGDNLRVKSTDILTTNPRVAQCLSTAIMAKTLNPALTVRVLFTDKKDRFHAVSWMAKFRPRCFSDVHDWGDVVLYVGTKKPSPPPSHK